MIKIKIKYDGTFIKYFKVLGHANYDDYGKDIVCASVSSIVICSVNMALKLDNKAVKTTSKEGFLEANILKQEDAINKVFINMIDMLKELETDYGKNIKIYEDRR